MNYLRDFSTRRTPQSEAIPGTDQVANSAGGYAWAADDWSCLRRFLVLGSEGGTYYVGQRQLTRENALAVLRCVEADGARAVSEIVAVSEAGRAPRNDPAIFALALAASHGDTPTRSRALDALPVVCRTGTHLFTFAGYVEQFRGWGRGLRRAVAAWYQRDDVDALAYQAIKYRQRGGWTHRDLLRLAHPKPPTERHDALYKWITGKPSEASPSETIAAFTEAQAAETPRATVELIASYGDKLPREALNPDHLSSPDVWDALLRAGMPMTALIRNLATMSRVGLLTPMSEASRLVCEQIADGERLRRARVHPLAVLVALKAYERGYSDRSGQQWDAVSQVVDALDGAFYAAFGNVEATGRATMLALDVSGSMGFAEIAGMTGVTPRVGSAAMALVTAAVEPRYVVTAFTRSLSVLSVSPRQRLGDVVRGVERMAFGGTDCALPMLYAREAQMEVDTFVVYTDSETWAGVVHPSQALVEYREATGIDARLVVVGMTSNGFTIADPRDAGMLDVVGFDTATPNVIADFSRGA